MASTILFFLTAYLFGSLVVRLCKLDLPLSLRPIISTLVGTIFLVLLLFGLGFILPFTKLTIVLTVLITTTITFIGNRFKTGFIWVDLTSLKNILLYKNKKIRLAGIFLTLLVIWLFGRALFFNEQGQLVAGDRLVWVDWPIHMAIATSFAYGQNFPPQNPTFSGESLRYPFFADFLSGVLLALGAPFTAAFIYPGIILTIIFFGLFIGFVTELLASTPSNSSLQKGRMEEKISPLEKSEDLRGVGVGILALIISLFWGGMGFVNWIDQVLQTKTLTWESLYPIREYSFWGEKGYWFFTFIFSEILPQRAFLFGLSLFCLICLLVARGVMYRQKQNLIAAGFLAGILPFFHTHTFISVWVLTGATVLVWCVGCLGNLSHLRLKLKLMLWFILPFLMLSLVQAPLFLGQSETIRFTFGWMAGQENIVLFWFKNTGVFLFLLLLGILWPRTPRLLRTVGMTSLSLFLLINFVSFAAWGYDNLKILTYWYLLGSILVGFVLVSLWQKNLVGKLCASLFFVSLIFTGVLEVGKLLSTERTQVGLWPKVEFELAEEIRRLTPRESVFLTAMVHDHPVPTLAGRKIVLGYPGTAWSWGLAGWSEREQDVHTMYKGGDRAYILWKKYAIDYIMVGDRERNQEPELDEVFIREHSELVLEKEKTRVYKIN